MRTFYVVLLGITIVFGSAYWFQEVQAVCQVPFSYRIGEIDEQFGIDETDVRLAVLDAEAVWEEAIGTNLFTYAETADFTINFVFDERHAFTDAEQSFKERLNSAAAANDTIKAELDELVAEYEALQVAYERDKARYEVRLAAYEREVTAFNQGARADEEAFQRLETERVALAAALDAVNAYVPQLNALGQQINARSEAGNRLIESYNQNVAVYNQTFTDSREFTQGDFQGDRINIYTFNDRPELITVLAHELGHALSIDHVENDASVMHYLIGGQPTEVTLSDEDRAGYTAICGDSMSAFLERLYRRLGV